MSSSSRMGKCFRLSVSSLSPLLNAMAATVTSGRERVCPFLGPAILQLAREPGHVPRHFVEFKATQKLLGRGGFAREYAGIDLRDVDRAAGEQVALREQSIQELIAAFPAVQRINNDACIEQQDCHQSPRRCRWICRNRSSDSVRIRLTHAAEPCFSSGWSLSFQEPAAFLSALRCLRRRISSRATSVMNALRPRLPTSLSMSATTSTGRITCVLLLALVGTHIV